MEIHQKRKQIIIKTTFLKGEFFHLKFTRIQEG